MSTSRGGVIVKTLWPVYDGASVSLGPPVTVGAFPEGASSVARGPALWRRIGGISVAVLMWWPVCYLVLELACFGGAAAFGGLGWSPTAGFNLAALIVAILLGGTFLVVHEL